MKETWISSRYLFQGKVVSLRVGDVQLEDGRTSKREIVEHGGGAAVVPVLDDKFVLMVRQYRLAAGKELLELPGGRLEPGESPELRARQELEEEAGYKATTLVPAAFYYSSPGFTDEKIYIYLGFGLKKVAQRLDDDEDLCLVEIPIDEIAERLRSNQFEDANAIIGLNALLAYLQEQSSNSVAAT